jgi:hypothetical protein
MRNEDDNLQCFNVSTGSGKFQPGGGGSWPDAGGFLTKMYSIAVGSTTPPNV